MKIDVILLRVIAAVCLSFSISACSNKFLSAKSKPAVTPRAALIKALKAKLNAKSYRTKMTLEALTGVVNTTEIEYVAPDKYRMISGLMHDGGKGETIAIGLDLYRKAPDGKWRKERLKQEDADFSRALDQLFIENLGKKNDSFVRLGERVDGLQAYIYEESVSEQDAMTRTQTTTWVDVTDGLPHKVEMDTESSFRGTAITSKTTIIYSDYNTDIKIVVPM